MLDKILHYLGSLIPENTVEAIRNGRLSNSDSLLCWAYKVRFMRVILLNSSLLTSYKCSPLRGQKVMSVFISAERVE